MTTRLLLSVAVMCSLLVACDKQQLPPAPRASLHEAIVLRNTAAVKAHLEAGADVNAKDAIGITPLIAAATSGQRDVVRMLLDAGADINGRGTQDSTALILAIQAEQPEVALFLLEQEGIDITLRESHGSTALVEAVSIRQMDVAEALLENGADINAPGPVGRTSLHIEAHFLDPARIKWLFDRGADPNARDDEGWTVIHHAVVFRASLEEMGGYDVEGAMDLIINSVDNINAMNIHSQTPLHVAVQWAAPWVIEKLLNASANPLAMDINGYSPVCYLALGPDEAPMRSRADKLAIISLFKQAKVTEQTVIDKNGATLANLEHWVRNEP